MVKANEIRHTEPDDAALDKIADPRFCEVVSSQRIPSTRERKYHPIEDDKYRRI
jgi:hypothetical protein